MTAPRWKPKSRPYNGDTIIAKSSGSNIKLACPAYGYPKPTTTWYKEDVLFDASQRPKVRLTIAYIKKYATSYHRQSHQEKETS